MASDYQPGKAAPLSPETLESKEYLMGSLSPKGERRPLTPDEFQVYYSYLYQDDDRVGDEVKAAIGLVLKSDLIRVYSGMKVDPKTYEDKLIESWVEQYFLIKKHDPYLFGKTIAEVYDFEEFLVTPLYKLPASEDRADGIKLLNYTEFIAKDAESVLKEFRIQAALQEQKDKIKSKKKGRYDLSNQFSFNGRQAYLDWVKYKINDYLAAIFSVHRASSIKSPFVLEGDRETRKIIVGLVENNKVNAVKGTELYSKVLNELVTSQSRSDFNYRRSKIISRYSSLHPILRAFQ